jgi:hypothetical protein
MRSPIGGAHGWRRPVYRGVHDPVRSLFDVIEEMTANLESELSDPRTLSSRRDEILQRLVLLKTVAA